MSFKKEVQIDTGYGRSFIVKKVEWGARPSPKYLTLATPVDYVILHHTTGESSTTPVGNATAVRFHQRQHIDHKHRMDIGYNFLVGEDGKAYEGRGWGVEGEHADGFNRNSIGIAVIGDFSDKVPNNEALDAIRALIAIGIAHGHIKESYKLKVWRDSENNNNECPGEKFCEEIRTWPHYSE